MNIPSTRNDIFYNQKCKQTTGFTNMEKCYYFLYQKHNLIILLKVNDFTKAWFLQGREWYSGKLNDNLQLWAFICLFSEMAFLKQTKHFHY